LLFRLNGRFPALLVFGKRRLYLKLFTKGSSRLPARTSLKQKPANLLPMVSMQRMGTALSTVEYRWNDMKRKYEVYWRDRRVLNSFYSKDHRPIISKDGGFSQLLYLKSLEAYCADFGYDDNSYRIGSYVNVGDTELELFAISQDFPNPEGRSPEIFSMEWNFNTFSKDTLFLLYSIFEIFKARMAVNKRISYNRTFGTFARRAKILNSTRTIKRSVPSVSRSFFNSNFSLVLESLFELLSMTRIVGSSYFASESALSFTNYLFSRSYLTNFINSHDSALVSPDKYNFSVLQDLRRLSQAKFFFFRFLECSFFSYFSQRRSIFSANLVYSKNCHAIDFFIAKSK